MGHFVDGPVGVRVPATSANLGPGFDSLGLALHLHDHLQARVETSGLQVEAEGVGAHEVPRDESHLVVQAMRTAFDAMGCQPDGLALRCHNTIPHGRGLGSSSAAIVGGMCLARELVVDGHARLDDLALLRLAADLEGHPDNVAPALLGGFVISGRDDDGWYAATSPVDPRLSVVVYVPAEEVPTEVARCLLPEQVSHADAARNSGRAALLVAALAGQPHLLWTATQDFLHQDHRETAMPASLALVRELRAAGHAAVVSGAGPSVLVLVADPATDAAPDSGFDAAPDSATDALLARCPRGWEAHSLQVDRNGCRADRPRLLG